jgi:phosphate transport system substrate-binding protein
MNLQIISRLCFITMVVITLACQGRKEGVNNTMEAVSGQVTIDGSSTVYPITEAVAEEFRRDHPKVKVTVGFSGTGGGFKKFGRGEIDINNASRPIKELEIQACKENNIEFIGLKVAYDGLAVVVSKENTWLQDITVEELKKIWEPAAQEKIKKWSQVRAGWPDVEFNLYGAGVASGTYDYFTEVIVGQSGSSRGDYTASEDDNVLVQGVSRDKNALGFFGIAYYEENKESLRLIPVNNGNGPVLPTTNTIMSGEYAPLSRPVFIYVSKEATKRAEVVEFVNFYLANAALLVKDVGYVSLHDKEYAEEAVKFSRFLNNN